MSESDVEGIYSEEGKLPGEDTARFCRPVVCLVIRKSATCFLELYAPFSAAMLGTRALEAKEGTPQSQERCGICR